MKFKSVFLVLALAMAGSARVLAADDPLPSWNDTGSKQAIVASVERVTREGAPAFVPVPERIATFDNDGTLWAEKPVPFQLFFVFDRVKALAPQHPEWQTNGPCDAFLNDDMKAVAAAGKSGIMEMPVFSK